MIKAEKKSGATAKTTGPSPIEMVKQSQPEVLIGWPTDGLPLSVMGEPMVHRSSGTPTFVLVLEGTMTFAATSLKFVSFSFLSWIFIYFLEKGFEFWVGSVQSGVHLGSSVRIQLKIMWVVLALMAIPLIVQQRGSYMLGGKKKLYQEVKVLEFRDFEVGA
ncbi:hypothetical protein Fot_36032 [Forsythia ovata]|uniref:Uncharacterized protein n=1 Tax=Forsythia ovata TaxID=205694 RepID=A0ABD1SPS1_9LAMI